jgi:hypothetical protein
MQIGKPMRIYTIEPIEDPVPKSPSEESERETESRPLDPVKLDATRP